MTTFRLIELEGPYYAIQRRRLWWWAFNSLYAPELTWSGRQKIWRFCITNSIYEANEAMERIVHFHTKKSIPKIVRVIKEVKV